MNRWISFCNPVNIKRLIVGAHLIFISLMLFGPKVAEKKKHHSLIVKTVQFKPVLSTHQNVAVKAPAKSAATTPKAAPASPAKQKTAPAPVKAKEPEQKKPQAPSTNKTEKVATAKPKQQAQEKRPPAPQIENHLIAELEEKLSKIEKQKAYLTTQKQVASALSPLTLQIDSGMIETDAGEGYVDQLIAYLYEKLQLPERGEVKIQLTLHQDGSIDKLIVLQAHSKRNRAYLEEKLVSLKFPPLEGKDSQMFTLNFCNADTR